MDFYLIFLLPFPILLKSIYHLSSPRHLAEMQIWWWHSLTPCCNSFPLPARLTLNFYPALPFMHYTINSWYCMYNTGRGGTSHIAPSASSFPLQIHLTNISQPLGFTADAISSRKPRLREEVFHCPVIDFHCILLLDWIIVLWLCIWLPYLNVNSLTDHVLFIFVYRSPY